jgi:LemA protein
MPLILLIAACLVVFFYGVTLYNGLVRLRHEVSQSWADIDTLLAQRHEALAQLVDTCTRHSLCAPATLNQLMETRAMLSEAVRAANVGRMGELEGQLRSLTSQLFAVAEAHPAHQTDAQLSHLVQYLRQLEDNIADRRERYNNAVNLNNVRIAQFPVAVVASLFGFRPAQPLRFAQAEQHHIDVHARHQR